jgi:serine/threonine protein kinase/CHASE1-domain containing sensor protein
MGRSASLSLVPRSTVVERYGLAALIASVGVLLTLFACAVAGRREAERNQNSFERRASVLTGAVARSFQMTREVVLSLPALFESSIVVEQREFSTFVRPALRRHPSLAALEWAPFVKGGDRASFEAKLRRHGYPNFEIREPGADGKMVRSGERAEYLPLAFLEPPVEAVRGLEVLFEPDRRVEIQAAIDQGTLHVSHRFRLVEDPDGVQSVAVYAPGYEFNRPLTNAAERRAAFLGLGIALFRLRPLIDAALAGQMREGIALSLIDPAAPEDLRVLYETEPGVTGKAARARLVHREVFDFGNRRYTVLSVGQAAAAWSQWLVLVVGLALTALAAGGVHTLATIRRLRRAVARSVSLGQYTLEEKIGEGAMGVVYRATHAMLRRPAAVKLLLKNRASEQDLLRFEREVQLTSRLLHPNTVSIFDYGRTADGVFYYAMEFLDGMDLECLVRDNGPLDSGRAIHVLAQVAGALAEAHLTGLIHRDIKPANIVLTERRDEPDVVKVVDFGLAKALEATASEPNITRGDAITGTPLYLAPEAITMPSTVDARADIYALGAVAYFLLTGEHVFSGATIVQVLTRHMTEQPLSPSERLGRPIAADLEALVLSCLAKDREFRPASAAALRAALLACEDTARYDVAAARNWWRERGAVLRTSARLRGNRVEASATMAIDLHHRPRQDVATAG